MPPSGDVGDEFACYGLKPGNLVIALRATVGPQRLVELELLVDQPAPTTTVDTRHDHRRLSPRRCASRREAVGYVAVQGWTRRTSRPSLGGSPDRSRGHVEGGFRPDIEGLRAIAVIAVIAFHVRVPLVIGGGFVGVDVFFVVSGFLITRLILGELAASGTISLRSFWGRRARRLLPASTLTVVVTVLFAQQMLPPLSLQSLGDRRHRRRHVHDQLRVRPPARRLLRRPARRRPARRRCCTTGRWRSRSSSTCAGRRCSCCSTRRPLQYRRLVLATIGVLAAASFVVGLWLTARRPSWAFFLLPARMGELLAGAALAVVGTGRRRDPGALAGRPGLVRPARHRRRLRGVRRDDAVAGCRRAAAGGRHDGA